MRSECKDTAGEAAAGVRGWRVTREPATGGLREPATGGNAGMARRVKGGDGPGGTQSAYAPTPNFGQSTPN